MKQISFVLLFGLFAFFLLGCVSQPPANADNGSVRVISAQPSLPVQQVPPIAPVSPPPSSGNATTTTWAKQSFARFSFEYPSVMTPQVREAAPFGLFSAQDDSGGETKAVYVVSYLDLTNDTSVEAAGFRSDPLRTTAQMLATDMQKDSLNILPPGGDIRGIRSFTPSPGLYISESPIDLTFSTNGKRYLGFAMMIYDPERSMMLKVRILAMDANRSIEMRNHLLDTLTFTG